ncbi:uncharacterized protein EV154DRAFT_530890 [Mucor mucedo]|uniref:uncharacterized protein n=1 Tax=Mucor mucedo TaxID=29922 RepID=UPI00221F77F1|nr:uncharacterized protein EV154DRAFT_530890 [Mucor mucedo]KAI7869266.1 hypothetical protein EV154DRAFT_530890 [Mucor mucedo]
MLPTPVKTNTSIYDSLPNLDSWYAKKGEEPHQIVPCHKQRTAVSFSTAPPAVYRYQERPTHHRRTSSSEHVKDLLKHYTSKLSRQLSQRS